MKLPRHATWYLLFIGLLSLLQLALGANLLVLAAIDLVCVSAVYPMTRASFDPADLLMLGFALDFGTFSLILKCLVLQPVQQNLVYPLTTSLYLVSGYGLMFLGYLTIQRMMTRVYPHTRLRRWTWLERVYANDRFLMRYTTGFSIVALAVAMTLAANSHSVQEITNGLANSAGFSVFSGLLGMAQLALAMQLALLTRHGRLRDMVLVGSTLLVGFGITLFNNQKLLLFLLLMTCLVHVVAYRIKFSPRTFLLVVASAALGFLYVIPLVHIVRAMQIDKADRISETFKILAETQFNPVEISKLENKIEGIADYNSLETRIDYLAPYNFKTDRFTLLMPIDQVIRNDSREPLGIDYFFNETLYEILPKYIVGEHRLDQMADHIAWRFSIRQANVIARPAMGMLGPAYAICGIWGILILGPLLSTLLFWVIKLLSSGSLWENPWAVFVASSFFFYNETDTAMLVEFYHNNVPTLVIATALSFLRNVIR